MDLLAQAIQFHQAGDFERAELLYRQILNAVPARAEVWSYLGEACLLRGRFNEAIAHFTRAVTLAPGLAAARNGLGVAYAQQNNWGQAVSCFEQAIQSQPDYVEGYNNLGIALSNHGKLTQAERAYQRALQIKPDYAEAYSNWGLVLASLGKLPEAIGCQQRALQLKADFGAAHDNLRRAFAIQEQLARELSNFRLINWHLTDDAIAYNELGIGLKAQGRLMEAIASFQEALRIRPDFPEALNNLGITFKERGNTEEAEICLRKVLALRPDDVNANNNLGTLLESTDRAEEAVGYYQKSLRLRSDFAEGHNNLAVALVKLKRYAEAEAHYRQAIAIKPNYAEPYCNLGNALVDQGLPDEAFKMYQQGLRLQGNEAGARSNYLFCLNYLPDTDPDFVFAEHCRWAPHPAQVIGAAPFARRYRGADEPLRVGYVSPDLRAHVLVSFLEPILTYHDPRRVQVFGYAEVAVGDDTTARLQSLCHAWRRTCGASDDQVAEQVRADGIDILVDLAGHTAGNRLGVFARKPAPVQVSYLGYPNTTGLSTIDFLLTDAVADPLDGPVRSSEELFRLPEVFCCFKPYEKAPAVAPLPAVQAGHVTFGSLHKLPKLNARVLDLWCRLLQAIPHCRLLVCQHTLEGELKERFAGEFARRGIPPDRIELRRTLTSKDNAPLHLDLYREIDIALDAFPWGGHTTACESLWMGVPMLTLYGSMHPGRMVASVLTRVGLSDWITASPEQYISKAVQFAADLDRLVELRSRLRGIMQASPLCDGRRFTRHLEDAYLSMWQQKGC